MFSGLIDFGFFNSTALGLITIVLALFYYYATSTYDTWRKLKIPYVRPTPFFGSTLKMFMAQEHQTVTFQKIYDSFPESKVCGFFQFRMPFLMVKDPELVNNILIKDFSHFTDHGMDLEPSVNILANSLFFLRGQRWRTMRHKLSPGFTSGKLKLMHDQIKECSQHLINNMSSKLETSDQIDVKEIVGKYTIDVIGTCAFGLKMNTIGSENSDFHKYGKKMFRSVFRQLFAHIIKEFFPILIKIVRFQHFPPDAIQFYHSVISDVFQYRTENNLVRNDLVQTLMQARKELVLNNDTTDENNKYTEKDIIGNAILLFTAGSETVSNTITFCLYELALNKNVQDKLREEIISTKEKHVGQINNDFLMDLHYASMILEEILRMYSVTITLFREATERYEVPEDTLVIEKGQKILIPLYSIHHDPKYYPNPYKFDPERFSPEEKAKRPNGTYMPFGDGPRLCIGKRFAELEMKLVLSEVLTRFEVLPCEKTEIPIQLSNGLGVTQPKNGVWLRFKSLM